MNEIITQNVEVRHHNGQCEYGAWLPIGHEDVPSWVLDLVADEIAEGDADGGIVEQGGAAFAWRKRSTAEVVEVTVMRYMDGARIGTIAMDAAEWGRYADSEHPAYEWPNGVARAGDVLSEASLERLGLDADTTIYLD